MQEAQIAIRQLLKAREDSPELLDLVDETLHQMPLFVAMRIILGRLFPPGARRAIPKPSRLRSPSRRSALAHSLANQEHRAPIRSNLRGRGLLTGLLWGGLLLIGLLWGAAVGHSQSVQLDHAALVVQFGDGSTITDCVPIREIGWSMPEEVLLDADALQDVDTYTQVGSFTGVCQIEEEGCNIDADEGATSICFCECQDGDCTRWSDFKLDDGRWRRIVPRNRDPKDSEIVAGDVLGWAWGDSNTVRMNDVLPFAQVCQAATPTPTSTSTSTPTDSPTPTPTPTATARPEAPAATATATAGPGQSQPPLQDHAALVVQFGDGSTINDCVPIREIGWSMPEEVLLDADALQDVDTYTQVGSFTGVCQIEEEGCNMDADEGATSTCFCECQDGDCTRWSDFKLDDGRWRPIEPRGRNPKDSEIVAGDVLGWAWGDIQIVRMHDVLSFAQVCQAAQPTPTSTSTATATGTPTATGTVTATLTATGTIAPTGSPTATGKPTMTLEPTATPADQDQPTPEPTEPPPAPARDDPEPRQGIPLPRANPAATRELTPTPAPSITSRPTRVRTRRPTDTPIPTSTPTVPTATAAPTATTAPTATAAPTEIPLPSPTPTAPLPTSTLVPTNTPVPTVPPAPTLEPLPTATPSPTPTEDATATMAAIVATELALFPTSTATAPASPTPTPTSITLARAEGAGNLAADVPGQPAADPPALPAPAPPTLTAESGRTFTASGQPPAAAQPLPTPPLAAPSREGWGLPSSQFWTIGLVVLFLAVFVGLLVALARGQSADLDDS